MKDLQEIHLGQFCRIVIFYNFNADDNLDLNSLCQKGVTSAETYRIELNY